MGHDPTAKNRHKTTHVLKELRLQVCLPDPTPPGGTIRPILRSAAASDPRLRRSVPRTSRDDARPPSMDGAVWVSTDVADGPGVPMQIGAEANLEADPPNQTFDPRDWCEAPGHISGTCGSWAAHRGARRSATHQHPYIYPFEALWVPSIHRIQHYTALYQTFLSPGGFLILMDTPKSPYLRGYLQIPLGRSC